MPSCKHSTLTSYGNIQYFLLVILFDFYIDLKLMCNFVPTLNIKPFLFVFLPFFPIWISRPRPQILKYFLFSFQQVHLYNEVSMTKLALVGTPSFQRVSPGIIVVIG